MSKKYQGERAKAPEMAVDLGSLKSLLDRSFMRMFYLRRYWWSQITDRLPRIAQLCVEAAQIMDQLPPDLVQQARTDFSASPSITYHDVGVREGYEQWADTYDEPNNPLIVVEEPIVLKLLGTVKGKKIADICCGTGRYSFLASDLGASLINGVDDSPAMLSKAEEKAASTSNINFLLGDIHSLPLESEQYDIVICGLALCHLPKLTEPVREMARLLKPGGCLIISDFHPACLMFGARTTYAMDNGSLYYVQNFFHQVQDYFIALVESGLQVTCLREPLHADIPPGLMDPEVVEAYSGVPLGLILKAEKMIN